MGSRKRFEDESIPPEHLNINEWPLVFVEGLSKDDQDIYNRRKEGIDLYFRGVSLKKIKKLTKIDSKDIYRLVDRCLELDKSGQIWGYRALIPRKRLEDYQRTASIDQPNTKLTGAFKTLLKNFPQIRDEIIRLFLHGHSKSSEPVEPVMRAMDIWKKFHKACRSVGLTAMQYPFNTKDKGRRSLERYLLTLQDDFFGEAARRYSEDAARHAKSNGKGIIEAIKVLQTVLFDGHRIDGFFTFTFFTPAGDKFTRVLERVWLLTLMDEASRAILGYYISLSKEYTATDVLRCFRKALTPWKPMNLTIPKLEYPSDGGIPSGVIPELQWVAWNELKYDNAKANIAEFVLKRLTRIISCSVNPGRAGTPEDRAIMERWYGIFEENGFHRLPNTTGSHPGDPRRKNPEQAALKDEITLEHLYELTDVMIADYNGTPHTGLGYLTPLETIRQRVDTKYLNLIPEEKRRELEFLTLEAKRKVCGSVNAGKRPYISYEGATYRSDLLSSCIELIGTELSLLVNVEDLRVIKAFLPDGSEFGYLTASGKWGVVPHSLKTRKEINKLKERKVIRFTERDSPVEVYRNYLASKRKDNKAAVTIYARMEKEEEHSNNMLESDYTFDEIDSFESQALDDIIKESGNVDDYKFRNDTNQKITKTVVYKSV
jgi:putative transposase